MAFPFIRASNLANVLILLASLIISFFFFLFGIANLINPDVSDEFLFQNTVVCIVVIGIGVVLLLVAIASVRGILHNKQKSKL